MGGKGGLKKANASQSMKAVCQGPSALRSDQQTTETWCVRISSPAPWTLPGLIYANMFKEVKELVSKCYKPLNVSFFLLIFLVVFFFSPCPPVLPDFCAALLWRKSTLLSLTARASRLRSTFIKKTSRGRSHMKHTHTPSLSLSLINVAQQRSSTML